MSFKAVWGFDPEEILKTQKAFRNAEDKLAAEGQQDHDVEGVRMPSGFSAQIRELRRLFRS